MTVEELKRHLEYTKNKHRNDFVPTSGTNISIMCEDILTTIENLETEIRADERTKVLDEVMTIVKAKISEKEYTIETMIELTDLGGKIQQLKSTKQ